MSPMVTDRGVDLPEWAKAAAALVLALVLAGVVDFALTRAGYDALGTVAWVAGYGGVVLVVWLLWLRDLEFEPGG